MSGPLGALCVAVASFTTLRARTSSFDTFCSAVLVVCSRPCPCPRLLVGAAHAFHVRPHPLRHREGRAVVIGIATRGTPVDMRFCVAAARCWSCSRLEPRSSEPML